MHFLERHESKGLRLHLGNAVNRIQCRKKGFFRSMPRRSPRIVCFSCQGHNNLKNITEDMRVSE
jgi:hypothetical protein